MIVELGGLSLQSGTALAAHDAGFGGRSLQKGTAASAHDAGFGASSCKGDCS